MPRDKVFVSYSHTDKSFLNELLPVLRAVPKIASNLWLDEQKIDIGDRFHPDIQQGLAASRIGILLLSNRW
jgi:TIR domain